MVSLDIRPEFSGALANAIIQPLAGRRDESHRGLVPTKKSICSTKPYFEAWCLITTI